MKQVQRRLLELSSVLALSLVVVLLWFPVLRHYHVPNVPLSDAVIEAARLNPADQVFTELSKLRFFGDPAEDKVALIGTSEKLLRGVLEIPGAPARSIKLPFDPRDLDQGSAQLFLASFGVPHMWLSAYKETRREEFFRAARDMILEWAKYEQSAWLPRGLLWNDHAIAERMLVLAEFWRLYRRRADFDPMAARAVLQLAARYGAVLAEPSHFTFATNHGVIQNLALWHFCLAFPNLANVESYKRLALERLDDQLKFYVNDEGVVLEHSPGYHKYGLRFLSRAFSYMNLLEIPVSASLMDKYHKAKDFYAQLRLPEGQLPGFGDTQWNPDPQGPLIAEFDAGGSLHRLTYRNDWKPRLEESIYPVAGYSVWWGGLEQWPNEEALSQTVVTWSHFLDHAHKHADEMSVWLWAQGQRWLANVGYWPYGSKLRSVATSWSGSNAPHLVDELLESSRQTILRSSGWSDGLAFLDLERTGPDGSILRRQVIWQKPFLWVVLDYTNTKAQPVRTVWTTSHKVKLAELSPGIFTLDGENGQSMEGVFFGSPGMKIKSIQGSKSPFAGWEVVDSEPKPAPAVIVEQKSGQAWAAVAWSVLPKGTLLTKTSSAASISRSEGPENWQVALSGRGSILTIGRKGGELSVSRETSHSRTHEALNLRQAPAPAADREAIRRSFLAAERKYQPFKDYFGYRLKITMMLCLILLTQEAFFAYLRRRKVAGYAAARRVALFCWVGGGLIITLGFDSLVWLYTQISLFF